MKQRSIGGVKVGEIGLGCMGMSDVYGKGDGPESLMRVFDRALEIGCDHWDTADMYGSGGNEEIVAKGLKGRRDQVFLATKFANVFDRSLTSHQDQVEANAGWIVDGTPAYARKCIENSLKRLEVDYVDLYTLHRVDTTVPIEETVGGMAELVKEGKVRYIGLSEAAADTIRRAHKVHPIAAVQSEYSLWTRDYENDVIPLTAELGIAFVPYSPLGRGFLSGQIKSPDDLEEGDWRRNHPRFQGDNFIQNLRIVDEAEKIAKAHGVSNSQVALAWVLAQAPHLCPIPGTKRVKYLEENCASSDLVLSQSEIDTLTNVAPATGARYGEASLAFINR